MSSWLSTLVFGGLLLGGLRSPWAQAAFAAMLWAGAYAVRPAWPAVPMRRLWGLWLAWTLISAAVSPEPLIALAAWSKTLTAFLVFVLACSAREDRTPHLVVAATLAGLAALILPQADPLLIGILQPYYNYTMALAAAAGAAAFAAGLRAGDRRFAWGFFLFSAGVVGLLLAARSRGGLLALFGGCTLALVFEQRWRTLGALALAAAAGLTVLTQTRPDTLKLNHPGAYTRPLLWQASLEVAADHPFFGEGPGRFEAGFLRHNVPVPPNIRLTRYPLRSAHAHSEYLQTAAESGWPALLFLLAGLAAAFWRGARAPEPWARAALVGAAALALQAVWDNIWALPALHWTFMLLLGTAAGGDPQAKPRMAPAGAVFGLAVAALAWFPQWRVSSARAAALRAGDGRAWMHKALAWAPENADLYADLARVELKAGRPQAALDALAAAEARNPTDATIPLMAGEILRTAAARGGPWAPVRELAERVLDLEPRCPHAQLLAAEAAFHEGRGRDAVFHLEAAAEDAPPAGFNSSGHTRIILHYDADRMSHIAGLLGRPPRAARR